MEITAIEIAIVIAIEIVFSVLAIRGSIIHNTNNNYEKGKRTVSA